MTMGHEGTFDSWMGKEKIKRKEENKDGAGCVPQGLPGGREEGMTPRPADLGYLSPGQPEARAG